MRWREGNLREGGRAVASAARRRRKASRCPRTPLDSQLQLPRSPTGRPGGCHVQTTARWLCLAWTCTHTALAVSPLSVSLRTNTHSLFPFLSCVSCPKVLLHLPTRVGEVMVVVRALFQPLVRFFSFTHNEFWRYRVDLTSMTPLSLVQSQEWRQTIQGLLWKVQEILFSHALALRFSLPHRNYKQKRAKERK